MAFPTFTPPIDPSPGILKNYEMKLLEAEFGEGYTQIARQGYNHIRRKMSLRWDALDRTQRDEIMAFFIERGGDQTFWWQVHDEPEPSKWICKDFSSEHPDGIYKISAEFLESFEFE
jgi:phage-related protein